MNMVKERNIYPKQFYLKVSLPLIVPKRKENKDRCSLNAIYSVSAALVWNILSK